MSEDATQRIRETVDEVYRSASRQILATLIRLLGDFDAAEEALHDAFAVAVEQWSRDGVWGMYQWLDRAPKGRNETGVWWRRHDEYDKR